VVGRRHAEESLHVDPDIFAGLLSTDGEVVGNGIQQ
jgi:hypothetical protein